jgi:hypothetical protein
MSVPSSGATRGDGIRRGVSASIPLAGVDQAVARSRFARIRPMVDEVTTARIASTNTAVAITFAEAGMPRVAAV